MKLLRQNSQVNNSKRIIALILFFAMTLSLTASFSAFGIEEKPVLISPKFVGTPGIDDIPFCIDEDVIFDAEHTVRLRYLETEDNIAAFSNPDGSATMYYFSNPIKYTDLYGSTVDIDNTIVAFEDALEEYKFKTKSAPATTYLPATIGRGNDVRVEYDGYSIEIMPISDRDADATTIESELKSKRDAAVLYRDVFGEGRSLKYTTLYNGVKEDIILESYVPDENSFKFNITTSGLELTKIDGKYILRNKLGLPIFELSEIFVFDSSEDMNTTGGKYSVEELKPNEIYSITVTVDEEWLKNATYPVTIDPTVTYNTDSGLEDAFQHPTNSLSTGSSNTLIIGNREGSVYRTFIKFPGLTEAIGDNIVTDANLYMKCYQYSIPRAFTLEMYGITSPWIENNYGPTLPYNVSTVSGIPTGTGSGYNGMTSTLNILPFVNAWLDADETASNVSTDNNGILFKMTDADEGINYYYAFYHSTEATNADDRPYVTISMSSFELPSTQQEGIRDNRFYWVSSGTSFITHPVNNTNTLSARDYTNTAQRLLFTYVGSGKYRISTEYSPTNYLTLSGNSLSFSTEQSSNNLWYVGTTNGLSYYIINAADTTKSLTTNGTSVTCSTSSVTNWTFEKCPTFYGQNTSTLIDTNHQYWNPNNLDSVFFNYTSSSNPLFRETQTQDLMDSGCALVAYAMILDNLNLKALTYDFRDGETKLRNPDPFYITLANTSNLTSNVQSITVDSSIIYNYSTSYNVISARHNHIVQSYSPNLSSVSKENAVAKLKELVISHPEGVWVYFRRPDKSTHAIVFTEYIGGDSLDSTPENDFIVYDPAANYAYQGSGVVFSNCKTYIDENEAIAINKPLRVLTFDQMVEIRIVE